jgi:hypothetical protein
VIAFAEGDITTTIGLTVGRDVEVEFLVNPHFPKTITLVIGESVAEIALDPATVEALRDKADAAVRELRDGIAALRAEAAQGQARTLVGAAGVVS